MASASRPSTTSNTNGSHSNVYINNLPDHFTDDSLRNFFSKHGEICSACVMVDQITKKSRNFGFVKFDDVKAADLAIRTLNNQLLEGKRLVVKLADADTGTKVNNEPAPSDNLYVKGLPLSITTDQLHNMFSVYGIVSQLKILTRPGHGSTGEVPQNDALVRMADVEQASWALQNLHLSTPPDAPQPILVRFADSPEDKQSRRKVNQRKESRFPSTYTGHHRGPVPHDGYMSMMPMSDSWGGQMPQPHFGMPGGHLQPLPVQAPGSDMCNLYINDLPIEADDLFLYRAFAPLGAITSVRVMRDEHGESRGFGFVKFVHVQDAIGAINTMNGKMMNGKIIHVSHKTASKHPQV